MFKNLYKLKLILLFGLVSCFSFSFGYAAPIPDTSSWEMICHQGFVRNQMITRDSNMPQQQLVMNESFFKDANCIEKSFIFTTLGLISYPDLNTNKIDFIYTELFMTIFADKMLEDFNKREVCGYSNWQKAQPQRITGLKCAIFNINHPTQIPQSGNQKFGIYKIENDQLFYGKLSKDFDGSSDEKRPRDYDLNYFIHLETR